MYRLVTAVHMPTKIGLRPAATIIVSPRQRVCLFCPVTDGPPRILEHSSRSWQTSATNHDCVLRTYVRSTYIRQSANVNQYRLPEGDETMDTKLLDTNRGAGASRNRRAD